MRRRLFISPSAPSSHDWRCAGASILCERTDRMWRWLLIGLVVFIVVWIFHDTWSYLRLEVRTAFWWMFP